MNATLCAALRASRSTLLRRSLVREPSYDSLIFSFVDSLPRRYDGKVESGASLRAARRSVGELESRLCDSTDANEFLESTIFDVERFERRTLDCHLPFLRQRVTFERRKDIYHTLDTRN